MPTTAKMAARFRERGWHLPTELEYVNSRLLEIAQRMQVLFKELDSLDMEIEIMASEEEMEEDKRVV